ncbi:RNA cytidine acetyltransferase-like [Pollicipes pollicipes]|uniref:RNA cytidine acetyltransferase-like n=1 Tax=Pollicipes pollicipes TaxID=41117 RepID=UPI00188520F8|nr:RNA cytidine acetyltransferase-like [Pollicipes pollicipes]
MVRKKIDNRIRVLIENGVALGHRTMFVVVGDKGRDQVVILHHMLSKASIRARPNVLWCYKKELGFSSHRKKRMRQLQKKIKSGNLNVNEDDPFELFVASTNIRYCYYKETHKILGSTYGMCVLQDFEALTPNLLARTVETVEGGGVIVLLLRSVTSLRQLYTMSMDVHGRYRTEAHQHVVGRFNERFILSLASCRHALVMDDQLNLLPISSHVLQLEPVPKRSASDPPPAGARQLAELRDSLQDTQPVGALVGCCKTTDQAKALLKFVEAISEKRLRATVSLTAARGRGKSAALGLAIAAAVGFQYSNIFVTSPSPENLGTLFEFVLKGFDAMDYQEHLDYELIQSTNPEFNKAIVRVNVFKDHRQTIQYIHPSDAVKLGQAELVAIDEAAAIPLPLVKALLGPYLVFMSSTINGYEGTGRSLSLKLLDQLRSQSGAVPGGAKTGAEAAHNMGRTLSEVTLDESIRYRPGDPIECWLNTLLCLDASAVRPLSSGCPPPQHCDLYYINRDTLFCYHRASEAFLQRLVSLYVASHYKNSPNDLQMMSDAPGHHLFCLLGPVAANQALLPEILCVVQVCLEGEISKSSILDGLSRGKRAAGDLIPWNIAQQYQDKEFPQLSGARVVRIATHPEYQGMGYGTRALELLHQYYEFKFPPLDDLPDPADTQVEPVTESEVGLLDEQIAPRKRLPPLLLKLQERRPEPLDYVGVSFGVTQPLLKFWKKAGYTPVYMRQTANDLTGEHTCIMLRLLQPEGAAPPPADHWLRAFWTDFRRRFLALLAYQFSVFPTGLALSVLTNRIQADAAAEVERAVLEEFVSPYDLRRLELYATNMADYHLITDLLPAVARLFLLGRFGACHLSPVQTCILIGLGLQHKTVDQLATELDLAASQLLGLFNRTIRKLTQVLRAVYEKEIEQTFAARKTVDMEPAAKTISDELEEAAQELAAKQKAELEKLKLQDLSQYVIKGSEGDWDAALGAGKKTKNSVSVKSGEKRLERSAVDMDIDAMDVSVPKKAKREKFKNVGKPKMEGKKGKASRR